MRKLFLSLLVALVATVMTTSCEKESDVIIEFGGLPSAAQSTINKHFDKSKILLITYDKAILDKDCTVTFSDGTVIDFDKNGAWESIESNIAGVPESIIPSTIKSYIAEKYKGSKVLELDKDKKGYDIKLNNTIELKFNLSGGLIGVEID